MADEGGIGFDFSTAELPEKGNPKLDSALYKLVQENSAQDYYVTDSDGMSPFSDNVTENESTPRFFTMDFAPPAQVETVRVIIQSQPGLAESVVCAISGLVTVERSRGGSIQAVVPISKLTTLAEMDSIKYIAEPMKPLPDFITSEGVPLINGDGWQASGYTGAGVKVGVLDIGFSGYTGRISEGELPVIPADHCYWGIAPDYNEGTEIHGTACAEIVYDVAPDAEFFLANFSTQLEYADAVSWLISKEVDVISCSAGWPAGGSGDGTGYFCDIVNNAKANGIFWAQSAGNVAQRHWGGVWDDPDGDGYLNFSGLFEINAISSGAAGETIVIALTWNDTWGSSGNDYDLILYDGMGGPVAASMNIQDGDDDPCEILAYTTPFMGSYYVSIRAHGTSAPVNFHLISYYHNLGYQIPESSLIVPADAAGAAAAGAVDYRNPSAIESYSSLGPTSDGRIKPDITAPDGVSNVSINPFYGTSAAAPHVAGAAVLTKQHYPDYTPDRIQLFLEGRAIDLGGPGKDSTYGSGRLHLGVSETFTLTMEVSGNGTVIPSAGAHTYDKDELVNITATPDSGWYFKNWAGDAVDNPNLASTNITMNGHKTVTAVFDRPTLTMAVIGSGSTNPEAGSQKYDTGDNITITAIPALNWQFSNWAGDVWENDAATTNTTMGTADKTVTANFIHTHCELTLEVSGNGTISPMGTNNYAIGDNVTITATPNTGYRFVNWTGDVSTVGDVNSATTNVTMNSDYTITANFVLDDTGAGTPDEGSDGTRGGGSGGKGAASTPYGDKTIASFGSLVTADGRLIAEMRPESYDAKAILILTKNTVATNRIGNGLTSVSIVDLAKPDPPQEGATIIGKVYEFGPKGASFEPAITLKTKYTETNLPEGITEDMLCVALWDEEAGAYIPVEGFRIDKDKNTIYAPISHFSRYTVIAQPRPPEFTISSLTVNPSFPEPGDNVDISIVVTNTGDLSGTYSCCLMLNGASYTIKDVPLEGGAQTTVHFTVPVDKEGSYDVRIGALSQSYKVNLAAAAFEVSALTIEPAEIETGQYIEISAMVINKSQAAGTYEIKCHVDGVMIDKKGVMLEGGASQKVSFIYQPDKAGEKVVQIGPLMGSFIVQDEEITQKQFRLPVDFSRNDRISGPIETEQGTPKDHVTNVTINWALVPGIGGGIIVMALVFLLVLKRKRGKRASN